MAHKLTVLIDEQDADYIKDRASREHRTISGQVNYMIEVAKERLEALDRLQKGDAKLTVVKGGRDE